MSSSSFQEKLQAIYQNQNKIAPLIEGLDKETPQQTLDHLYVKLKTILKEDSQKKPANYEAISGKKQEIEVEALFDPLPNQEAANQASNNKLLILGGAGVGKSTLMQYIAYQWSQGKLWKDKFDYVYRVSLKVLLKEGWDRYIQHCKDGDLLKSLVHYNLIDGKSGSDISLEEMVWEKEKTLLLFDGYDEVIHKAEGSYKEFFDKILAHHQNIIFTSRPNAVKKDMASKFYKKIENVGFDQDGIRQYLTWYFRDNKEKGSKLEEFLEEKSSIKSICHIPVNIAMICFIWEKGDSHEVLHKISNMSDLYHQVIDQLGYRYYDRQCKTDEERFEFLSKWKGGKIRLDELRVLRHTAYKGLTGGGIEVSDEKRTETLVVAGMITRDDKTGISVQSSINYLTDELDRNEAMPSINKVYKYGLLKPEGFLDPKKEPSETDLQAHSFSFIHLSFQEFLTAQYFAEKLLQKNNYEEQTRIANFIAQHRNEPRYLMTWKFMAGIFNATSIDDEQAKQGILRFWDAIMCNPEGMLEFGIETKVTLLMHLFSQTKSEDKRIPNQNRAMDLIDSVVLGDLSSWSTQLKESDYTSQKIKEGLIYYFINEKTDWLSEESFKLQKEMISGIKNNADNSRLSIEGTIDIIKPMINRFSEPHQNEMFIKASGILTEKNKENWKRIKKATEFFVNLYQKAKLKVEAKKEEELLSSLLEKAEDSNLDEISCKAIHAILSNSQNSSTLFMIVLNHLKQELGNRNEKIGYPRLNLIAQILIQKSIKDTQLIQDVIKCLTLFFRDKELKIALSALGSVVEFLKIREISNQKLVQDVLLHLIAFVKSEPFFEDLTTSFIIKVIQIWSPNDPQLIKFTAEKLSQYLMIAEVETYGSIIRTTMKVIKMDNKHDIQSIQEYLKIFFDVLKTTSSKSFDRVSDLIVDLIKNHGNRDLQLIREALSTLTQNIKNREWLYNTYVGNTLTKLFKLGGKDQEQLTKDTMNALIQVYQNSAESRSKIFDIFIELVGLHDKEDLQIAKIAFQISIQLLQESNDLPSSFVQKGVLGLVSSVKHPILVQDALKILIPLLQVPNGEIRIYASQTAVEFIKSSGDYQGSLIKSLLDNLVPLLQDSQKKIKIPATNIAIELMKIYASKDTQVVQNILEVLTSILKDPDSKMQVAYQMLELMKESGSNVEFTRNIFTTLTPLLKDWKENSVLLESIINVIDRRGSRDSQLARDIFDILTPILKEPDFESQTIDNLIKLMWRTSDFDTQLTQDIFHTLDSLFIDQQGNIRDLAARAIDSVIEMRGETQLFPLIPLLKQKDQNLRKVGYQLINQLMKEKEKTDLQDVLDSLKPFLHDPNQKIKEVVSKAIAQFLKVNGSKDTELVRVILTNLVPLLEIEMSLDSTLSDIIELSEKSGFKDNQIFTDALNILAPLLQYSSKEEAPSNIIELTRISPKSDDQLIKDLYEALFPLLDDEEYCPVLSRSVPKTLFGVMKRYGKIDDQLVQKTFDILFKGFKSENKSHLWSDKVLIAESLIELIELTQNHSLLTELMTTSTQLFNDSKPDATKAAKIFEMMVLQTQIQRPDDLIRISIIPQKRLEIK